MVKLVNKFSVGLALGAWAGHYLSTEKGQAQLVKAKQHLAAYTVGIEPYKVALINRAKGLVAEQLQAAYENKEDILSFFTPDDFVAEEQPTDTEQEATDEEDIVITYISEDGA